MDPVFMILSSVSVISIVERRQIVVFCSHFFGSGVTIQMTMLSLPSIIYSIYIYNIILTVYGNYYILFNYIIIF